MKDVDGGVTPDSGTTKTWTYTPPDCSCVDEHVPGCPVIEWLDQPPYTIEADKTP